MTRVRRQLSTLSRARFVLAKEKKKKKKKRGEKVFEKVESIEKIEA